MGAIEPETVLTTFRAAKLLQVDPSTVNNWIRQGRIRAFRTPGGHGRIRACDLVCFMRQYDMPVPAALVAAEV